ncbi:MAG TPA: nucleoside-diphosphate sugar epimerase/dehydratase [Anaerohalosphaeraceae bacterium]|nr:nucleoside-diphosphate sugar epimerase/dehydratase [Anaerohalosphaeraceae bacterium]HOL31126.1 nucleoside-diphosphate sugar epimerase/dehydratase [Anaerohalosphaeraceae bacterium]HOM74896.1 nucleoside-diphosphate sugar epimerase/dehydratase [Anaerohalosphaeraceae bacterium]HPC63859.1 nucleoside-diphosphate sugar epimerase/dehydratase [Anaerohalosphaeraceae bacterium]HPO68700.1 nucleoside-diphosphate sugar epimerase/dehydratase [Anaerohalosphaeraceae bacterium]
MPATEIQQHNQQTKKPIFRYRRLLIILAHISCFFAALLVAFTLAFAYGDYSSRRRLVFQLPILFAAVLPVKLFVFARLKQFHGWWRYVGLSDLLMITKASFISWLVLLVFWYGYVYWGEKIIPLSVIDKLENKLLFYKELSSNSVIAAERTEYGQKYANLKGLYDLVRVARIPEVVRQQKKTAVNSESRQLLEVQYIELNDIKRSIEGVLVLDLFATVIVLSGLRMLVRLYHEEFFSEVKGPVRRFLIVGAGNAGEALLREMLRRKDVNYQVVGLIDDDPAKIGMSIHGITVLGNVDQLPEICRKNAIDEIAIAMPGATRKQMRRVIQVCQGTKLRFSTVPSLTDIASGKLQVSQMRTVDINDLLGREVVNLDLGQIETFLKDKIILVTGAGGSIGSEMCRQVCAFRPRQLLLVEQAENPLFFIDRELRQKFPEVHTEAIICDIVERARVFQIFDMYRPQIVIHAAAHKHVPLMETNPGEAIKNNVVGTCNIADAADAFGADNFVMISTDKAVNPTSIMGSSKRIAEMYIQDLNATSKTHFVTVRFGNVLGSNGSVIPIFNQQIAAGGPITVTHPEMRRYFMTIPEASQLVLQAAAMGQGGEIFVLDMGEPVKIVDLARELITLSGFRPGEDIEIEFTGLRPGEKLFEELSIEGEDMLPTKHPKIAVWKNIPKDRQSLRAGIEKLIAVAATQDRSKIVAVIKELVPNYIGKD